MFGGYAGGSWAGTGADSTVDDSFLMELSPYPRRWESIGTNNYLMKAVNGWPEWGNDELRFGINGALGQGQNHPHTYATCIAGTVYGTEVNQPCGAAGNSWGDTHMEVYYRCGEGSGNGPCPWEPPPPPAVNMSFGDNTVLIPENKTTTTTTSFANVASVGELNTLLGAASFSFLFTHLRNGPQQAGTNEIVPQEEGSHIMQWSAQDGWIKKTLSGSGTIEVMYGCPRVEGGTAATYISLDGVVQHEATTYGPHIWSSNFTDGQELVVGERSGSGGLNLYYVTVTSTPDMAKYDFDRQSSWEAALESWGVTGNWTK